MAVCDLDAAIPNAIFFPPHYRNKIVAVGTLDTGTACLPSDVFTETSVMWIINMTVSSLRWTFFISSPRHTQVLLLNHAVL
jgi:hypothetical protein